jgi:ABC-type glycerol-3-phosphate transport system substrate-binding protein
MISARRRTRGVLTGLTLCLVLTGCGPATRPVDASTGGSATGTSARPTGPALTRADAATTFARLIAAYEQADTGYTVAVQQAGAGPQSLAVQVKEAGRLVDALDVLKRELTGTNWPADVRPLVDELVDVLTAVRAPLAAMAAAPDQATYTKQRLQATLECDPDPGARLRTLLGLPESDVPPYRSTFRIS